MQTSILALYGDRSNAEKAVQDAAVSGFPVDHSRMFVKDAGLRYRRFSRTTGNDHRITHASDAGGDVAAGATAGATIGTVAGAMGGFLAALPLAAIPGLGPIIALGPAAIAASGAGIGAASGAAAGAAAGATAGAINDPVEDIDTLSRSIPRGGVLIEMNVEAHEAESAVEVLARHHPVHLAAAEGDWRVGDPSGAIEPAISRGRAARAQYVSDKLERKREAEREDEHIVTAPAAPVEVDNPLTPEKDR